jgi:hypothetical protein
MPTAPERHDLHALPEALRRRQGVRKSLMDRHQRNFLVVIALPFLLFAMSLQSGGAGEKNFTRLGAKDIRLRVIGKVITDDIHWSDYFRRDGTLLSEGMGRKTASKWQIRNDELCVIKDARDDGTCYEVWLSDDEISLRLDGIETPFQGYLRKYEGP